MLNLVNGDRSEMRDMGLTPAFGVPLPCRQCGCFNRTAHRAVAHESVVVRSVSDRASLVNERRALSARGMGDASARIRIMTVVSNQQLAVKILPGRFGGIGCRG